VQFEVQDCAFPLVQGIHAYTEEQAAFTDIEAAFLVGAMPRRQGMERKDLLSANVKIFASQGKALAKWARPTCKVIVVGNPANTNALICAKHAAPRIPAENITAMTRLDENRARAMLASKHSRPVEELSQVIIWGNHSSTQVVDFAHAKHKGQPLPVLPEYSVMRKAVRERGAAIIERRKLSSAMSAAKAASDHMRLFYNGSNGQVFCMAVYTGTAESKGDAADNLKWALKYGAVEDLIFSLPVVVCNETKKWRVVPDLTLDAEIQGEIELTKKELVEERDEALSATTGSNL
jgi:malate dehydrogenase